VSRFLAGKEVRNRSKASLLHENDLAISLIGVDFHLSGMGVSIMDATDQPVLKKR